MPIGRTDTITGGASGDILTGGLGADQFVYTTITDSLSGTTAFTGDTLTDFLSGTDLFDVTATQKTAIDGTNGLRVDTSQAWDTDFATTINNAFTGGTALVANGAGVITITGTNAGTYLILNNGTAAFSATDDGLILLGGTSSTTLATTDFV